MSAHATHSNFEARVEEFWKKTIFLVEANSFEQMTLWREWSLQAVASKQHIPDLPNDRRFYWEQQQPGQIYTVAVVKNRPICLSVNWYRLDSEYIAFIDATSVLVDWKKINDWIEKRNIPKWDNGTRPGRCNAMNFHLCVDAIRERQGRR